MVETGTRLDKPALSLTGQDRPAPATGPVDGAVRDILSGQIKDLSKLVDMRHRVVLYRNSTYSRANPSKGGDAKPPA
jgi:hypothetical protein